MKFFKICTLVVSLACLIFPVLAQDANVIEYNVTAETANMRAEANTSSSVVGVVHAGDTLLIYDESSEDGWLRIYRDGEDDAYIADFLVERAPQRFYPITQEPILEVSGRGKDVTDIFDIPTGAYRIDAEVADNFFILKSIAIEGDCRDDTLFNEGVFDARSLEVSTLFISDGCSIIFETDNVDGDWSFALRNVLDLDIIADITLQVETGTSISGVGTQMTMPTFIPEGIWTVNANVDDNFFILHAEPLGDCDSGTVFNEGDFDADTLEVSTVYRANEDCVVYWLTSNVDEPWEISFEKLR